ncbi:MAG: hypothetical protein LBN95_02770 [Prevotellaceae bacterium]|jgi:hypothetical protein|nr:hypothetical protein [Prevotellaceae bacterium]
MKKAILFLFALCVFVSCEKPEKINPNFYNAVWEFNFDLKPEVDSVLGILDTTHIQRKFILQVNADKTLNNTNKENYFEGRFRQEFIYETNTDELIITDTVIIIDFHTSFSQHLLINFDYPEFEAFHCSFATFKYSLNANSINGKGAAAIDKIDYYITNWGYSKSFGFTFTGKRIKNL